MTESPSYKTALLHKSAGIDLKTVAALDGGMLAAIEVKTDQESQDACTNLAEVEKRAMKSESVVGQPSRDICNELTSALDGHRVVTRAEVTEIVESCKAKVHYKIQVENVENVVETIEDIIQTIYSDWNDGLKSKVYNIFYHALKEVESSSGCLVFEEI